MFYNSKLLNYGPEMLYYVQFLYLNITTDSNICNIFIKKSLIRCIIYSNGYKTIDLILKYINIFYTFDIKYNKNSIYNIYLTFSRLAFNAIYLFTIK